MKSFFVIALALGCALGLQSKDFKTISSPNTPYLINGTEAADGQYPYMLSLRVKSSRNHLCGASILTKNWALTSASCCTANPEVYLYSGSVHLSKGGQDHQIESMKVHEEFNAGGQWTNDICVIKVRDNFTFSNNVQQVTLPTQGTVVKDGDIVTVTGWGYTVPGEKNTPDVLQVGSDYTALTPETCQKRTTYFHESYLCAMGERKVHGICNGDGGSPLVRNGVQVGVASWLFQPCASGFPDFYARVPIFVDWIKQNLGRYASELKFAN